jgi:phosphoribosyl 1,2-cyclic phosphodiesterase
VRICVLGSGSSGNCTYIETGKVRVLIDLGFGKRSFDRRMREAGLRVGPVDAVLLTHGHSDHVSGAAKGRNKKALPPIFTTEGTLEDTPPLSECERIELICADQPFEIGNLRIEPFAISHDARQPVAFRLEAEGVCGAVVTDLGELTDAIAARLAGCDWLIIESNHDEELLKIGPYPWFLKQRLLSPLGHLSNQGLGDFLSRQFDGRAAHVFLAHLSRHNNDPVVALDSASRALNRRPAANGRTRLHLTHQDKPSIVINL